MLTTESTNEQAPGAGPRRPRMRTTKGICFCGQLYTCEECGGDVCQCTCDIDGAPHAQAEVTAGYVNPSQAKRDAWTQRLEARR